MRQQNKSGFTLIELMIVVTIIVTLASIAVPNLVSARLVSNETAAVAALRTVVNSQVTVQNLKAIDANNNGIGEYGSFAELAGRSQLRGTNLLLAPPVLAASFGTVNNGTVSRLGYHFRMFLPGAGGVGVAEDLTGGIANAASIDPNLAETFWCAYAWPQFLGNSGRRTFFVNQQGELLQAQNSVRNYSGTTATPVADAAFSNPVLAGDISGAIASNGQGSDGETWNAVSN